MKRYSEGLNYMPLQDGGWKGVDMYKHKMGFWHLIKKNVFWGAYVDWKVVDLSLQPTWSFGPVNIMTTNLN